MKLQYTIKIGTIDDIGRHEVASANAFTREKNDGSRAISFLLIYNEQEKLLFVGDTFDLEEDSFRVISIDTVGSSARATIASTTNAKKLESSSAEQAKFSFKQPITPYAFRKWLQDHAAELYQQVFSISVSPMFSHKESESFMTIDNARCGPNWEARWEWEEGKRSIAIHAVINRYNPDDIANVSVHGFWKLEKRRMSIFSSGGPDGYLHEVTVRGINVKPVIALLHSFDTDTSRNA